MKICVLSEELANPLDEGIKKFSYSLIKALSTQHYVLGLSKWGLFEEWCRVEKVPMNKLLLNWGLWRKIRRFAPQVICYAPSSSGSFFGFLRGRILKWYRRRARLVLISLQPKSFSPFLARLVRYLRPDMILVQSEKSASFLEELGCSARIFSSGVEMEKFAPVSEIRKQQLRRRHGLPSKTFLVLHVGHINPDRGVALFRDLQEKPGIQTLLVGSTSTLQDEGLARDLEDAGVRVMRDYIPGIQEIYQLSDRYLFPVSSRTAAIEFPLSVLEAMACNLPIITTRYGGLAELFPEGDGFLFADTREEVLEKISQVQKGLTSRTRSMVECFTWENVLKTCWQRYFQ